MRDIKQILEDYGIILPQAPMPAGNYRATIEVGKLMFISGQLPFRDGKLIYKGQLGKELTIKEGNAAAELCALNLLSHMSNSLQQHKLKKIVKIEGFINCRESFTEHAEVLNGASDFLSKTLFEKAGHIRTVVGCNSLPLGAAIEIAAIVEFE
ncbi:MAG: RidA family protein [Woeseiaceae bacterium]